MSKNLIQAAQKAYYEGSPILSDEQYDYLVSLQDEEFIGPKGNVPHVFPMWSLQKVYPGRGDKLPDNLHSYVETPKLDGAAVEVVYIREENNYVLSGFTTRGDGKFGKWVGNKFQKESIRRAKFIGIPVELDLDSKASIIQVAGELASTKELDNARNVVAGSLNLKSFEEFEDRCIQAGTQFFAYSVKTDLGNLTKTYRSDMSILFNEGFSTVLGHIPESCPKDGIVYRLDNNAAFEAEGYTAKYPKGAFAVKGDKDYLVTTLLDVEWSTGRTGKITPTGIIETVDIDGAKVSRATLNNPKFIEEMGLEIGCKVKIIRAGEIIPCILGRYDE